jgi:hypothetical protein
MIWTLAIGAGSILGSGNILVKIKIPGGYSTPAAAGAHAMKPSYFYNVGVVYQDSVVQVQDSTNVSVHRAGAGLPNGALSIYFTIILSIN